MKKQLTWEQKKALIAKIADMDAYMLAMRGKLSAPEFAKLHQKRDRLERQLYA